MPPKEPAVSFDAIIQEGRKKAKAEQLAQEIFGKNRRSSAPPAAHKSQLGGSLASRVGVNKQRNSSLPRNAPRQPPPAQPSNRRAPPSTFRSRPSYTKPLAEPAPEIKSSGDDELNIRGAASGSYTVVAQNFAPGTTAADIESVMFDVGGQMSNCRVVAAQPTVIVEMVFVDKEGGQKVVDTFNGKRADGRPLYVYWKSGPPAPTTSTHDRRPMAPALDSSLPSEDDTAMALDEQTSEREAANRAREERRGRDERDRDVRPEVFARGSGGGRGYEPREPRGDTMDGYEDRRARGGQGDVRRGGGYGSGAGRERGYGGGGGGSGYYGGGGGGGGGWGYGRQDPRAYGRGQRWG